MAQEVLEPSRVHSSGSQCVSRRMPQHVRERQQQLKTIHLIQPQVMDAIGAPLEPADDDGALRQVDVIPAQIASLGDPQAMAVDG